VKTDAKESEVKTPVTPPRKTEDITEKEFQEKMEK
jgi:hypothetical protein